MPVVPIMPEATLQLLSLPLEALLVIFKLDLLIDSTFRLELDNRLLRHILESLVI